MYVQAALQEVRGTLLSKKRELCRLCRDEEHLDSPMAAAQEEYDEMLLELQHQQQELSMLKVEEECAWLTDEEGVIRYLEAVQAAVTAREEELANVLKVRSHSNAFDSAVLVPLTVFGLFDVGAAGARDARAAGARAGQPA